MTGQGIHRKKSHQLFRVNNMRLWSIHPKYYDDSALARCIGEGLGGLRALCGLQKMHRNHPQLERFKKAAFCKHVLAEYIYCCHSESLVREKAYNFDFDVMYDYLEGAVEGVNLPVTTGQIQYECKLLLAKMRSRSKGGKNRQYIELLRNDINRNQVELHPLFYAVPGPVESWEKVK
jgi:hypothetical protein